MLTNPRPPTLDLPFDAGSLAAMRRATHAYVTQAGMPAIRATDMVVALHKLAANAVSRPRGRASRRGTGGTFPVHRAG